MWRVLVVFLFFFIFFIRPGTERAVSLCQASWTEVKSGFGEAVSHTVNTGGDWLCRPHCYSRYAGRVIQGPVKSKQKWYGSPPSKALRAHGLPVSLLPLPQHLVKVSQGERQYDTEQGWRWPTGDTEHE